MGENGYLRIAYGECGIESTACYIASVDESCSAKITPGLIGSLSNAMTYGFEDNEWAYVNANYSLTDNVTVPSGKTLTLQSGNVSVPPGKALTIQSSAIVNLNGHYLKSTGGTITDNGASWNPDIAVKQGSTLKGHYPTIQSAINAASNGQTVYVASGTYDECVLMKAGVNLVGAGSSNTIIDVGTDYTTAVMFDEVNAKLTGFKLRGHAAVYCRYCSPTIEANSIYNSEYGIYAYGYGSSPNIKDNSIGGCTIGIMLYNQSDPEIRQPNGHNTITGSGRGVVCLFNSKPELGLNQSGKYGNNNILTGGYDVHVNSGSGLTIKAERNWWGGSDPSIYTASGDEVDWQPPLSGPAKIVAGLATGAGSAGDEPGRQEYKTSSWLLSAGRYGEALESFKRVIEAYPDSRAAESSLCELMFAYRKLGREEDALAYLKDVAVRYSNTPLGDAALRASVTVLSRLGLGEKALARVSDLLERFKATKWERDLLFEKGMIYKHNLGDQQKATEVFEDFVQSYPDDLVSEFAKLELGYDPSQLGREKAGEQGVSGVSLSQNHPSPFNAETMISFTLSKLSFVKLEVYNTLGQRIRILVGTAMEAGTHAVIWDGKDDLGRDVSSGIYLYCLKTGEETLGVRKMLLLK